MRHLDVSALAGMPELFPLLSGSTDLATSAALAAALAAAAAAAATTAASSAVGTSSCCARHGPGGQGRLGRQAGRDPGARAGPTRGRRPCNRWGAQARGLWKTCGAPLAFAASPLCQPCYDLAGPGLPAGAAAAASVQPGSVHLPALGRGQLSEQRAPPQAWQRVASLSGPSALERLQTASSMACSGETLAGRPLPSQPRGGPAPPPGRAARKGRSAQRAGSPSSACPAAAPSPTPCCATHWWPASRRGRPSPQSTPPAARAATPSRCPRGCALRRPRTARGVQRALPRCEGSCRGQLQGCPGLQESGPLLAAPAQRRIGRGTEAQVS